MKTINDVFSWIEGCIMGDIRPLLLSVEKYSGWINRQGQPLGGCNYLLASVDMMLLEYLSYLYGPAGNAEDNVYHYVKDFLATTDPKYLIAPHLIWKCYRNGLLHHSWPKVIKRQKTGETLITGVGISYNDPHLEAWRDPSGKETFCVNGVKLFYDIECSYYSKFKGWAQNNESYVIPRATFEFLEIQESQSNLVKEFENIQKLY